MEDFFTWSWEHNSNTNIIQNVCWRVHIAIRTVLLVCVYVRACVFVRVCVRPCVCLSFCPSVCLSVCLSVCALIVSLKILTQRITNGNFNIWTIHQRNYLRDSLCMNINMVSVFVWPSTGLYVSLLSLSVYIIASL